MVEVCPAYTEDLLRIEFFGDEIERLTRFEPLTGHKLADLPDVTIFPDKQFVTPAAATVDFFAYAVSYYNRERLHSALGYQSPVDFENQLN